METALIVAIGYLITVVIAVPLIEGVAIVTTYLFGRERFLAPTAVSGCNWAFMAAAVSAVSIGWFASSLGWRSLYLVLVGPGAFLVPLLLFLRFGDWSARRHQFKIDDATIVSRKGSQITPIFLTHGTKQFGGGIGSEYQLFWIELHSAGKTVTHNGYTIKEPYLADLARLLSLGVPAIDVEFTFWESPQTSYVLPLGQEWAETLCGTLDRLPEDRRRWWRQWLLANLQATGDQEVNSEEVVQRMEELLQAYPALASQERVVNDVNGLRALVPIAGESLTMTTSERHWARHELARGSNVCLCDYLGNGLGKYQIQLAVP